MPFLTFSNIDVQFAEKELTWRTYTTKKALPTTCRIELINWKEFAKTALDKNIEAFVVHVSSLGLKIIIHSVRKAQMALLLAKKITVLIEYPDFANMFLKESVNVFTEQTGVNKYAIELDKGKQPPYKSIYSLEPVKFKTLKTYIEINLANGFIKALKLSASAPILFVCKPNSSFCLYVNY